MKCPVCQKDYFSKHELEAGLPAYKCKECEGIWVSAAQYWKWLETRSDVPEIADAEVQLPVEQEGPARLCPETGHFLRRYKVWPDIEFYLDRCGNCTGVWFDAGEWEALRSRDLHDQVHLFFSDVWQRQLREDQTRLRMTNLYREKFGEEDYARIQEIRAWLEGHAQGRALLAYLTDRDPYSIAG
ncbi:MAG: zf-TFIIB domain-containing protein [Chloroflexi bacterium]|nr:zf-TFIIB domain-containing protein [Chloroflexota bacterium]MBU1748471.1 zf-TFIIB domain-containing protein [Chloroflexota bacterium]MBU1879415.1 zf-TFIIB domain-containing protein [Chloroflexota bacterium]